MNTKSDAANRVVRFSVLAAVAFFMACGGGGSNNPGEGGGGGGGTPVNNVIAVSANQGPANNFVNGLFTSVTICVPGTTNCQTIPNIEIDTGSEGLRLLASQVTLALPAFNDATNTNPLQECVQFADGSYIWGPIVTADIQMAGEKGPSNSVQLIPNPSPFAVPSTCASGGGPNLNTLSALGANGIIGLGIFQQDCGSDCGPTSTQVPAVYYLCPNNVCQVATVPLLGQMQNPVWTFPQDNNGFQITMPALQETGAVSVAGSMIFGVGTQTNNALGTAKVYTAAATGTNAGNFQTTYNSISYPGFIDSGSNGYYMLDAITLGQGMQDCTTSGFSGFYCPAATTTLTMTNTGLNGTAGSVTFRIANAVTLLNANNSSNWVFDDLGGPNSGMVDYGMPFFYGRTVFIGIENQTGPGGAVGPYWAF